MINGTDNSNQHLIPILCNTGLRTTVTKTALAMKELQNLGYTENGIGGAVSCKLNYVDNEDEVVIEVRDFDVESISVYYYWYTHGGRLIYCQECGKLVLTDVNRTQYCKKCQKERELLYDKKYNEKRKK
jgi:hypothetical protein